MRWWIAKAFSLVEDAVYVGLGFLLACSAASLLVTGAIALWKHIFDGAPLGGIVDLLDRSLIALMIVELLYTLQVSFRAHSLVPEPFLVVGLIAVTRRILVLTAQFSTSVELSGTQFKNTIIELALLTVMVIALVASLMMLRKQGKPPSDEAPRVT
jgi:uncharacterized membrane protein (DUF373 family)